MKVCFFNTGDNGSTGGICESLSNYLIAKGNEVKFILKKSYCFNENKKECFSGSIDDFFNKILIKLCGTDCFKNKKNTRKAISYLKQFKPDIVHIQNVHSYFLNIKDIIDFCSNNNIKIVWTLHDCWAFTGRCAHFDFNRCTKWENECSKCEYKKEYPSSFLIDKSKTLFNLKKETFTNKRITFVVPSMWLKRQFEKSFLSNERVLVINNGIKERSLITEKDIVAKKEQLNINCFSKIVFSAAYPWSKQKGLDYVLKASNLLKDKNILFIIAGLSNKITRSDNLLFLPKIETKNEMDLLYSLSDVFFNPTLQETSSLVNIESLSNGTPVITFNTGGAPETVDPNTGIVVEKQNLEQSISAILSIKKDSATMKSCFERASLFTNKKMLESYYKLYLSLLSNKV